MKNLLIISALFFGACSHRGSDTTTPSAPPTTAATPSTAEAEPVVDPTLPSWAPRSCADYHAAVVQLASCQAVSQETRDAATAKYDADHAKWQAMQHEPQGAIDEVRQSCADDAKAVRAQMRDTCG